MVQGEDWNNKLSAGDAFIGQADGTVRGVGVRTTPALSHSSLQLPSAAKLFQFRAGVDAWTTENLVPNVYLLHEDGRQAT